MNDQYFYDQQEQIPFATGFSLFTFHFNYVFVDKEIFNGKIRTKDFWKIENECITDVNMHILTATFH